MTSVRATGSSRKGLSGELDLGTVGGGGWLAAAAAPPFDDLMWISALSFLGHEIRFVSSESYSWILDVCRWSRDPSFSDYYTKGTFCLLTLLLA